ncbi:MAG TPA: HAD family phosphatase [Mycobacteriales bacterium]|jgi:HAD superfamily hydrolase (TIGR01509 family)
MTLPAHTPVAERTGRLRAVLFDMDGLLVDSEPVWTVGGSELMARLNGPWSLDVKALVVGRRVDEACRIFVEVAGSSVPAEEAQEWLVARMCALYRADLPVLPGALELVDACRAAGVATALVSSSYRALVEAALETLGADRFDVTVAGDEVALAKPAPEPYERAAAALGAHPGDCVVVEDSLAGCLSGEAAGCAVVAVPNVVDVPGAPGRTVVASLTELTVERLRGLV